jgi:hypothetical protein
VTWITIVSATGGTRFAEQRRDFLPTTGICRLTTGSRRRRLSDPQVFDR